MLNIVADENIPLVKELFSQFGVVTCYPGRNLTAALVAAADILLVRSVTPVNACLLEGSRVRFVGTCTIGTDHLDTGYLDRRGIAWSSAPGCNANSVVEYVFSVMARLKPGWLGASFGIVGCGNVGGRLHRRLRALQLPCRVYDPFLNAAENADLHRLDSVLQADVICLHAPLTLAGSHPSYHLLDQRRLQSLPSDCLLISAGRGAVVDNQALKQVLPQRQDLRVALDVWEPEPEIDVDLLQGVHLGSPHVAGYSFDGRVTGTRMILQALQRYLGQGSDSSTVKPLAGQADAELLQPKSLLRQSLLNETLLMALDIAEDDSRLRQMTTLPPPQRAPYFDQLRKNYRQRREFHAFRVVLESGVADPGQIISDLDTLGFGVTASAHEH